MRGRGARSVGLLIAGLVALAPISGHPAGPEDSATTRPFEPKPRSKPIYGVKAPSEDPERQTKVLKGADGIDLYVETWLPVAKGGNVPPAKIPTILLMTPYAIFETGGGILLGLPPIEEFVSRGFAFAEHHVRGTGKSGGCLEQTGANQIDDGARVVEYLGRDAPWSDGNVGMWGISYDAETQISVAGLGDPEKIKYLKAIIPASSVGGQYEYSYFDGVPYIGWALTSNFVFYGAVTAGPSSAITPQQYVEKLDCQDEVAFASVDQSGDWTTFWHEREYRPGAPNIRAATLMVHGLTDFNVLPMTEAGFFDRLPATTPHKGLFGIWDHAFPDDHSVRPEWNREDWLPMQIAWYDRYLKGLPTGVESWPAVQVQGTDGQWRAEPNWPSTGGPVGHLSLGPDGTLGSPSPTGSGVYSEGTGLAKQDPSSEQLVFETDPLRDRLEITGQPILDLWVTLDKPDAHLVAEIETFDAAGEPIEGGINWSMRSAQHLDPIVNGQFAQEKGKPAPVDTPVNVQMRFLPTDLVIPKGGSLRLTISGLLTVERPLDPALVGTGITGSTPSGSNTSVTVLHDCAHPSALRFLMPRSVPDLLHVRDARGKSYKPPARFPVADAGGVAVRPVCGKAPARLASFGPAVDYRRPAVATKPPAKPAPKPKPRVLDGKELPATGFGDGAFGITLLAIAAALGAVAVKPRLLMNMWRRS